MSVTYHSLSPKENDGGEERLNSLNMILFLIGIFGVAVVYSNGLLELKKGDVCRTLGGDNGTCILLKECLTIGDFKTNQPPICDFEGFEPIVCCPSKLITKKDTVQQLCTWLENRCHEKLNPTRNVVGGEVSSAKNHTFMVLIGYGETEKEWVCGGSLITARYVLSAAHCTNLDSKGTAKWVRLGELDLKSTKDDAKPVDRAIIEIILHRNYKRAQNYHDIALFKLDSNVVFNDYIMPICLHTKRQINPTFATVIGWGRIGFAEATSEKLLEADIKVYNDTECKRLMFSTYEPRTPRGHDANQMICAGVPDGSKDACLGDSGGPLVVHDVGSCIKTQIGIISYGKGCGNPNAPGVYTRVSNYISWIEEVAFKGDNTFQILE